MSVRQGQEAASWAPILYGNGDVGPCRDVCVDAAPQLPEVAQRRRAHPHHEVLIALAGQTTEVQSGEAQGCAVLEQHEATCTKCSARRAVLQHSALNNLRRTDAEPLSAADSAVQRTEPFHAACLAPAKA
jgi:hypothetical protein